MMQIDHPFEEHARLRWLQDYQRARARIVRESVFVESMLGARGLRGATVAMIEACACCYVACLVMMMMIVVEPSTTQPTDRKHPACWVFVWCWKTLLRRGGGGGG